MKKFLSSIMVVLLVLGGILYLPEFFNKPIKTEDDIIILKSDDDVLYINCGYKNNSYKSSASRSRGSGNIYYISLTGDDSKDGLSETNAWRTIKKANQELQAGDKVYIKNGIYKNDPINPDNSGTSGNYITYQSYNSETVTLTGGIAIKLTKDCIKIDDIDVGECDSPLYMNSANYCLIQNCHMEGSGSGYSWIKMEYGCNYNQILNNSFIRTPSAEQQVNIFNMNHGTMYNLISGNYFEGASHGTLSIEGDPGSPAMYNVIRENEFNCGDSTVGNGGSRAMSISGAYGEVGSHLVEDNVIYGQADNPPYCLGGQSKFSSSNNILRRNTFYDSGWYATCMTSKSSPSALQTSGNRAYNNVYYNNYRVIYLTISTGGDLITDIKYVNDIYHTTGNIAYTDGGVDAITFDYCVAYNSKQTTNQDETTTYTNMKNLDPLFINITNHDFHLKENSPCIDNGTHLTKTTNSGNGNKIYIGDASYFFDGFGIVDGDLIQLEGQMQTARIINIDYQNNSITVNKNITWKSDQGVSLPYIGSAPDIGAYEYGEYQPEEYQPGLKHIEDQTVEEDSQFSLIINTTEKSRAAPTLELSTNASWVKWGVSNHTLFGIPTNEDVGSYWVCISLNDNGRSYDENNFTMTVNNVNDPPTITTSNLPICLENELYSCDYDAEDIDPTNDQLSWFVKTNASFLKIESVTGILSGKPSYNDVGNYWVNVSVKDNNGGNDFENFTLIIKNINNAPQIIKPQSDISFKEDTIDKSLNMTNWFEDVDNDLLIFSCIGNKKMNVIIQETGTVELIPEINWCGTETLTFIANDTRAEKQDNINITVTPVNDAPSNAVIESNTTKLYIGQNFSAIGSALDVDIPYGDQLKFYWYIYNSNTHFAEGKIINTPLLLNNSFLPPGNYSIKLVVKDSELEMCDSSIEIEIFNNIDSQPKIISTNPVNNAFDVKVNSSITIKFNEPMNKKSVENVIEIVPYTGFYIKWDITNKISEICFNKNLEYDTSYKITIGIARDIAGNQLINAPYILNFKTEKIIVTEPESVSLSLKIISPPDHTQVRPYQRITISGSSEGFNEGDQVYVKLLDENAIAQIDSKGLWSITLRAPRRVGSYKIVVEAGTQTQSLYLDVIKLKTQNVKRPRNDFNIQEPFTGLCIFLLILLIIITITILFIKKKRSRKSENRTKLRNNKEKSNIKKPRSDTKSIVTKQLPVKLPKRKKLTESTQISAVLEALSEENQEEKPEKKQGEDLDKIVINDEKLKENNLIIDEVIPGAGIEEEFELEEFLKNEFEETIFDKEFDETLQDDNFGNIEFEEEIGPDEILNLEFEKDMSIETRLILKEEKYLEFEKKE